MTKGYELVEPPSLDRLMVSPSQQPLAVAIMTWALHDLRMQQPQLFAGVEVEVIAVNYAGIYPAVCIHYLDHPNGSPVARGPALSEAVDAFVERASFSDFCRSLKHPQFRGLTCGTN